MRGHECRRESTVPVLAPVSVLREFRSSDQDAVIAFSLRAWEPVFNSLQESLGHELFQRLRGDWRVDQAEDVRAAVAEPSHQVWVADDANGRTVGFVVARLHRERRMGEIYMIAVDPDAQNRGIGAALARIHRVAASEGREGHSPGVMTG
jgi:ribosomal protein S18 acetylase RimI-like enzyme